MAPRKKGKGIRGGNFASDDESYYSDVEPPRTRRKLRQHGKVVQVDFDEDEDPFFDPEIGNQRPVRQLRRSTRQPSKTQGNDAFRAVDSSKDKRKATASTSNRRLVKKPPTSGSVSAPVVALEEGSVDSANYAAAAFDKDDNEPRREDLQSDDEGVEEPGALGITWHGVPTNSAEIIGIFCAAWKNRDREASKLQKLVEIQQRKIEVRDERLMEKDIEAEAKDQELRTLRWEKDKEIADSDGQIVEELEKNAELEKRVVELEKAALNKITAATDMSKEVAGED